MQTSLSHDNDEAQTVSLTASQAALGEIISTLSTLLNAAHGVAHAIVDGDDVKTLDDAKEGLSLLLNAFHAGIDHINFLQGEMVRGEQKDATGSSSLN